MADMAFRTESDIATESPSPRIVQISVSNGGVPKLAVDQAIVGERGITTDWQHDRLHHGGAERALCLYAIEHIQALRAEGHPVAPGTAGENITTAGIDFADVHPGTRLRLGPEVEIEITSYTAPCRTIAESFAGGDFTRISQKVHPGWSRVYARVVAGGSIRAGDPIVLLSPDPEAGFTASGDALRNTEEHIP